MRILGIEFGSWSLKAVELESRFRRLEVLDFHEIRLPLEILNPTETYQKAVTQLMARLPSHPEKIVSSLPAAHTALRFLPIPIKSRKQVEKMYRFELEDTVPFKLANSIVEHFVMTKKDGSVVFAAIAPDKHVKSHLEWLQSVGVDPDWLTFEGMGLINLYLNAYDPKVDSTEPVLVMDIGHHKTNLSIFEHNRLELFRSISWGGSAITQSLSMALGASAEEAERFKMNDLKMDLDLNKASTDDRELMMAASQAFHPFIADINHSLVAFRTLYKKKITSVQITGGSSQIWGLNKFLSQSLSVPVTTFDPLKNAEIKKDNLQAIGSRFGEAYGRALVFARKSPLLFNFRTQSAAKGTSLKEISKFVANPSVVQLLTYAAILLAILLVHVNVASYLAKKDAEVAQIELRKVFGSTFRDVPSKLGSTLTQDPEGLQTFIQKRNNELAQKLKMMNKERTPMLNLVNELSKAFPSAVKVDVNTMQVDDRSFEMIGVLYEGDLNEVVESLKKSSSFDKINLTRDGKRFTFRGNVVGR